MTEGVLNELLKEYRDTAWESGWYAGAIEKNAARMSDEQLKEYSQLMNEAITKRTALHEKIMRSLFHRIA